MSWNIGTTVRVRSDNENYDKFRDKKLAITHIAHNRQDHPGYDEAVKEPLYDLQEVDTGKGVPCSLYRYELEKW